MKIFQQNTSFCLDNLHTSQIIANTHNRIACAARSLLKNNLLKNIFSLNFSGKTGMLSNGYLSLFEGIFYFAEASAKPAEDSANLAEVFANPANHFANFAERYLNLANASANYAEASANSAEYFANFANHSANFADASASFAKHSATVIKKYSPNY